jgi:hypothetical protein
MTRKVLSSTPPGRWHSSALDQYTQLAMQRFLEAVMGIGTESRRLFCRFLDLHHYRGFLVLAELDGERLCSPFDQYFHMLLSVFGSVKNVGNFDPVVFGRLGRLAMWVYYQWIARVERLPCTA